MYGIWFLVLDSYTCERGLVYTLHGWDLDVSGVIRLRHCFSPRERALLPSAAALAPRGLRAKVKLPTQAMSNTHPRGLV